MKERGTGFGSVQEGPSEMSAPLRGGFVEGMGKGAQGELVAVTGGLIDKESSILAENYLGWVDTGDSQVQMGIGGGRVAVGAITVGVVGEAIVASASVGGVPAKTFAGKALTPVVDTIFNVTVGTAVVGGPASMEYARAHPEQVAAATSALWGYASNSGIPADIWEAAGTAFNLAVDLMPSGGN